MLHGSCLCGKISYRVREVLGPVSACHCTQCRKISGHFTAAVPARWSDVTLSGAPRWYLSSAQARRGFCPDCGSYLFWEEYDGLVYLLAGALDGATGLRLEDHIFTADKGDYYQIADGLPCHAQGRET
ncbi:MAG: GFA family protein [Rhodobacteraceae bacterium]|jgi:hypothetical protein|nr:GFA family protein [Paracoccaceae bacterium]